MDTLFIFLGKVIITSGVLFLYYQLLLKDKTFHHYNRYYLLASIVISLLLPLLKVSYFSIEVNQNIYLLLNVLQQNNFKNTTQDDNFYTKLAFATVGLVAFYFLIRFLIGIVQIFIFKNKFPKQNYKGINFYFTNLENAPFSFFRDLFWKQNINLNSDLGKQILKHEMVHIEQKHSLDKIFLEVTKCIFWFNPFFWLIQKELYLIHEYLADHKAVQKSDTKAFAEMILESHFSGKVVPATNPFLHSNLKKRLKMLQKPQTKYGYLRRIFALPLLFTLVFVYIVKANNKEIEKTNEVIAHQIAKISKNTVSQSLDVQLVQLKEDNGDFNTKIVKDSTKNYVETRVYKFDKKLDNHTIYQSLNASSENDSFIINGKKVSKKDFEYFLKNNYKNKEYFFGCSESGGKIFFIIKKLTSKEYNEMMKNIHKEANEDNIKKLNGGNNIGFSYNQSFPYGSEENSGLKILSEQLFDYMKDYFKTNGLDFVIGENNREDLMTYSFDEKKQKKQFELLKNMKKLFKNSEYLKTKKGEKEVKIFFKDINDLQSQFSRKSNEENSEIIDSKNDTFSKIRADAFLQEIDVNKTTDYATTSPKIKYGVSKISLYTDKGTILEANDVKIENQNVTLEGITKFRISEKDKVDGTITKVFLNGNLIPYNDIKEINSNKLLKININNVGDKENPRKEIYITTK